MDLYNLVVSAKITKGGGGGDVSVDPLSVTENGTYTADEGHAYSPVTVSVPSPTGTTNITSNGIYDVASFASASVNVPGIVPSGTSSITANGIYDITNFASVDVNVSGGGGDHDAEDGIIKRTISGVYENSRITEIGIYAFYSCTSLTGVSLANAEFIRGSAFAACGSLAFAYLPKATTIGAKAFMHCKALMSVYLLNSSVCGLTQANEFSSTPMVNSTYTGAFGSIYVPASLVDSYKAAYGFSSISDRITSYVE